MRKKVIETAVIQPKIFSPPQLLSKVEIKYAKTNAGIFEHIGATFET